MSDAVAAIRNSPIDYPTAMGYATSATMLALLGTLIAGTILATISSLLLVVQFGWALSSLILGLLGIGLGVVGLAMAFGAIVGIVFKVITDGVALAHGLAEEDPMD